MLNKDLRFAATPQYCSVTHHDLFGFTIQTTSVHLGMNAPLETDLSFKPYAVAEDILKKFS